METLYTNVPTKNASDRPHVNPSGVVGGSQQDLRCSVPEGDNLMSVALERDSEGSSKSKISNLENPFLLVKEKVLGLEVTVENTMAVAVCNTLAELEEEALDEGRREGPGVGALAVGINELLEVSVKVLEDKVQQGLGGSRGWG